MQQQYSAMPLMSALRVLLLYPNHIQKMAEKLSSGKALEHTENREAFYFAIVADGDMIGVVELGAVDYEKRSARCDYGIASSHWGRGITTRAVALALTTRSVNSAWRLFIRLA